MFPFRKKSPPSSATNEANIQAKLAQLDEVMNAVSSDVRGRIAAAISGGYDFADTMHNVYVDYGYPGSLDFFNFWNMYRRFGIAKNVVDLPVDVGWMVQPTIESSDAFMKEFDSLNKQVSFWQRAKGLDKRQRVGRYGGMFMRVRDNKKPSEPIEGKLNGLGSLMDMIPLYEGQLEVSETEQKITDERYSLPTMYQFKGGGVGDRNEKVGDSFQIHWTRIIPAAEGADNGGIYGIPALEAGYNSLMDLRKIIGAGGEGFYRNAAQSIMFDLKDASTAKTNESLLNEFNEQVDDFMRNRMRRSMWTPGMDAKTLESALANPKEFFMNALNDVAAGSMPMTPATILIGQQTGRLASNEDSRSFLSSLNSRNGNWTTSMIRDIVDWLQGWGILQSAEYEVEWADLLELSDEERLANALQMAESNARQFDNGGEMVFTAEEIRDQGGFDAEDADGNEILPIPMNAHAASETNLNNSKAAEARSNAVVGAADSIGLENFVEFDAFLDEVLLLEGDIIDRLIVKGDGGGAMIEDGDGGDE